MQTDYSEDRAEQSIKVAINFGCKQKVAAVKEEQGIKQSNFIQDESQVGGIEIIKGVETQVIVCEEIDDDTNKDENNTTT